MAPLHRHSDDRNEDPFHSHYITRQQSFLSRPILRTHYNIIYRIGKGRVAKPKNDGYNIHNGGSEDKIKNEIFSHTEFPCRNWK